VYSIIWFIANNTLLKFLYILCNPPTKKRGILKKYLRGWQTPRYFHFSWLRINPAVVHFLIFEVGCEEDPLSPPEGEAAQGEYFLVPLSLSPFPKNFFEGLSHFCGCFSGGG
jgi:hypothetical protein